MCPLENRGRARKRCEISLLLHAFVICISLLGQTAAQAESVVRDHFIVFENMADVAQYLKKSFPQSAKNFVPASDKRYARAEAILAKVWQGYRQHKPHLTTDLPQPEIVLLEAKHIDAYIATDPKTKQVPNAVFIFTRVLEMPDNEIAGLLGHELTHLLSPEFTPTYYKVSGSEEPLGYLQTNNSEVKAQVRQLQSITEVVGPYFIPELNGLPAPIVYDGQLFNFFLLMAQHWGDPTKKDCQHVMNPLPAWRFDLLVKYFSPIDQKIWMTESQRKKLDQDSKEYIASMYGCLGQQQAKLIPTLSKLLHETEDSLNQKYFSLAQIFDAEKNIVDGILTLAKFEYRKLAEFQSSHSFENLRVYSHEEFADDEAVQVLKLTEYAPTSLGQFFLSLMQDTQPEARKQCEEILRSGKVPPYGLLTDAHHATCFRVYHIQQLVSASNKL